MFIFRLVKRGRLARLIRRRRRTRTSAASVVAYKLHKPAAQALAEQKVAQWNQLYNFSVGRISIKNARTRWGSCSAKGNLNFNYKIALLPEHLADYLVVHELCHIGQFNHSQAFWNLVAQAVPEYRERRAELKKWRPSLPKHA